ncbi:apoptotic chromatin condensation inducer 1b isoform X4 [Takifugu flavidus]|uniref:apoptotic chromatin condensation inducer 1b isoform X4 n=1 Tax=Takifugu flavidus TaxID=433684 RepID=UPI0025447323|nr:apoptotic chromatin condensation inducer 1b isoform X4 [Takifugu flavidus]
MADEDITLDGKPLQSLRVADLKAALEQRNLSKSGQKNTLVKRLKGALMLENLQKSSSSHCGLQPNSQIGQEMSQNSFIQQYLAKQQELLRQRLEREAQQNEEANDSPAVVEEDEDQLEDNDSSLRVTNKHSQSSVARVQEKGDSTLGPVITGPSAEVPGAKIQQAAFQQGHKEPPTPSPPRAIASLSVRVLAQPPAVPRTNEEGAAPTEPGSAHPVLHLSRSAGGHAREDSDADDSDDAESEDDEDWGPGPGGAPRANRAASQPQQAPPSMPATFARSKRKLQPPQHIPPPQAHHAPMQLRHPTPPPSPPPNLFPLPDTPKQSPPDTAEQEGESAAAPFEPHDMQNKDSDSSSCSSSPEPPAMRKPGPLSLLVQKMESEVAFNAGEGSHGGPASSSKTPTHVPERRNLQGNKGVEEDKDRGQGEIEEREMEKKSPQEDTEEERKQPEGEKLQEEEKPQDELKRREEKHQMQTEAPESGKKKVRGGGQDSDSSSDSDSKSDSSSGSSSSSSSSEDKSKLKKKSDQKVLDNTNLRKGDKKNYLSQREVSPSAPAVTEMETESESSVVSQPPPGTEPESREGCPDESPDPTPKTFAARKISLTSSKTPPANPDGGMSEADTGSAAGRKRRWGSSTSVITKKPSISITTDSLKSLIPDIKLNQEAVVELHPEELQLSGDEESQDAGRDDQAKGLKIRRTITQVVPSESHENGETKEEEEMETTEEDGQQGASGDTSQNSVGEEASEPQPPVKVDGEAAKVTPSDSVVRRSISQQKSGVSVTIDDPVRTTRQPSPSRGKLSNIIHVTNLVRPFTLGQLKELLNRTGTMVEEGFWIDKIKSHCIVTYATTEEAVATRDALHRVKWPLSNPKVLSVDFCQQEELDFHKGILKPEEKEDHVVQPSAPQNRLPPLMPERDRERDRERERDKDKERERDRGAGGVRDLWAEREKEMQRRERARGEREWDRDKVREFARPGEEERRSRSRDRERRRRERGKSKERKADKKAEKADEPPAKLLDDLFLKTKAAPCIYWLPLTEEQVLQKLLDRTERQKERERRHKELKEEEEKKREDEKKDRLKVREKDAGTPAGGGGAARGADGERERGRDRDGDKKRDGGHRPGRPSEGAVGGRHSRSRSNPRDRRR